jgi:tricorn protease
MKCKLFIFSLLLAFGTLSLQAQNDAKMLRFPAIHGNQVVFSYAGDLYTVDIKGGLARQLTNDPEGFEIFARFSPDGKNIAFTGQYDGNTEVYVMPAEGGEPQRVTYTATLDRDDLSDRMGPNNIVMTWKDNENIVYRSRRITWDDFIGHLFVANINGGLGEQLPFEEGGWISYSPDGTKIAFNRVMREFRTWKYYRGGMADDVWIFDFNTKELTNITNNVAQDIFPMWAGDKIYFCSDRDRTMNIFCYDLKTKAITKVTNYTYYDVKYPSLGDNDIVYENGGELFRLSLKDNSIHPIPAQIIGDNKSSRTKYVDASKYITSGDVSPDGKRIVLSARGDVWTLPVESGITRNLTKSDGVHDRNVAWSPDGEYIAYISDRTGNDELYIQKQDGKEEAIQLTDPQKVSETYKYQPSWSPDSKKITWYDKMNRLMMIDVASKKVTEVAKSQDGEMRDFSWSPDSKWIAYSDNNMSEFSRIFIYNVDTQKAEPVTDTWFNSSNPTFDKNGKYLYFTSERDFNPTYSSVEWNYAYREMSRIYMITLQKDTPSPFLTKNDEVTVDKGEAKEEKSGKSDKGKDKKKDSKKEDALSIKIDFEGIMSRIIPLPDLNTAYYYDLNAVENGLYYMSWGNRGGGLYYYDLEEKEATKIGDFNDYYLTPDGKKMVVRKRWNIAVINAPKREVKGIDEPIDLSNMKKWVNLHEEWAQIYTEAWRQMRDFFYAPNMHGNDWPAIHDKYAVLIPYCGDRNDVNYLIGEMIGELNIGHAYTGGGDRVETPRLKLGLLGAELERDGSGYYKINKILKGESWNDATISPLTEIGVNAKEGDFIVAIDGVSTKDMVNIYEALIDKAGKAVVLSLNSKASESGARDVVVTPIESENSLYYYNMVQNNIEKVSKATNGQVGYIHIPDMGVEGLNEFVKYFYPQLTKKALIIDDRGNGGGNVSPMIIERLRREASMWTVTRNGNAAEIKPNQMINGPKVLLFNKYSASDGDLFPWQFKHYKLGTTIGTRSWGGVVGIRGSLPFIDGGTLNRPEFAPFDQNGNWIIEGHGVDPDIVIDNNPYDEFNGVDAQLDKAIEVILEQMKDWPEAPAIPEWPDKTH